MVSGSSIYQVTIGIAAASKAQWRALCRDCAGAIDSLVELLQGRFSKAVMDRICRQDTGLFPRPSEIRFHCSCPDSASMCKHVAAVLYGVGSRLDEKPELLFLLRAVDGKDLTADLSGALPLAKRAPAAAKVLATEDLSALFGLDLDGGDAVADGHEPEAPGTAKTGQHRGTAKPGAIRRPVRSAQAAAATAARPKPRAKSAARRSPRAGG